MKSIANFLNGKKTYIGVILAIAYSLAIYFKIVESNELIWTAILGWTGVSLRLAIK